MLRKFGFPAIYFVYVAWIVVSLDLFRDGFASTLPQTSISVSKIDLCFGEAH